MNSYNGSKFRFVESYFVYDEYGYKVEKKKFIPTSGYMKYLKEKEEMAKKREIEILKHSLEYQYKTYGEVDKYDYQRFCAMVGAKPSK